MLNTLPSFVPVLFSNVPPKSKWLQVNLEDENIYIKEHQDNSISVVTLDAFGKAESFVFAAKQTYRN